MREFQERKKFKHILYSKTTVIVMALMVLFFARAAWGVYQKEQESAANVVRARAEMLKLKDREDLLKSELSRLNTEDGIEEEIRSKYGVTKPGEQMIIIVDQTTPTTTIMQEPEGWWDKFKNIFR
ncbi:MAG: septum formation initiator family protein [Patescibacteria group bacterium]